MKSRKNSIEALETNYSKEQARNRIIDCALKNISSPISFLGLPGLSWEFEKLLVSKAPSTTITGAEVHKDVYSIAKKSKPKNCEHFYFGDISELLKSNPKKYNFIWLDYMGAFCPVYDDAINSIFSRDRIDCSRGPALLSITIKNNRDMYMKRMESISALLKSGDTRTTGVTGTVLFKAASAGYAAKLVETFTYLGGVKSPMQVYSFLISTLTTSPKKFEEGFTFSLNIQKEELAKHGKV